MAVDINLTGVETTTNKQNSLAVDGTNTKYPTVTAVNSGLAGKQNVMGADDNYVTDAQLVVISNTSGTNTGDETTTTIGVLINNSTAYNGVIDDLDKFPILDASDIPMKHTLWSNIKARLKIYFDTIYKPTFSENTAFNKNFGTTSGTVLEGNAARYMTIPFSNFSFNPADATTYYIGRAAVINTPKVSAADTSFYTGVSGTIEEIQIQAAGNTVQGSTEDSTIKIHNITQSTTSSSFGNFKTNATATTSLNYRLTSTTFNVLSTDEIALQWDTPTWATNPTAVRLSGWILIKLD